MINRNYIFNSTKRNSRIGKVYQSIQHRLDTVSCPNCWGRQEYDAIRLEAGTFKKPENTKSLHYIEKLSFIQKFVKTYIDTSKTSCVFC